MAWGCFWYLERKDEAGRWQLISSSIREHNNIHVWDLDPNGNHDGMTGKERGEWEVKIEFAFQRIATDGMPSDASEPTSREFQSFVEHSGCPPYARHVLVQEIVNQEQHGKLWYGFSCEIPAAWKNWIDRMKALGPLEGLRYIFVWAR